MIIASPMIFATVKIRLLSKQGCRSPNPQHLMLRQVKKMSVSLFSMHEGNLDAWGAVWRLCFHSLDTKPITERQEQARHKRRRLVFFLCLLLRLLSLEMVHAWEMPHWPRGTHYCRPVLPLVVEGVKEEHCQSTELPLFGVSP